MGQGGGQLFSRHKVTRLSSILGPSRFAHDMPRTRFMDTNKEALPLTRTLAPPHCSSITRDKEYGLRGGVKGREEQASWSREFRRKSRDAVVEALMGAPTLGARKGRIFPLWRNLYQSLNPVGLKSHNLGLLRRVIESLYS
ncbi:hypothetical protein HAX54_030331 [Datura stramonium]|uniref:Uncharacterized protein n=1 Tax=Datura stramonium TaxID=4076 RepID=A0ABS8V8I7_DATST|nr:hypothetical protein [Datura stramonium]